MKHMMIKTCGEQIEIDGGVRRERGSLKLESNNRKERLLYDSNALP